MEESELVQIRIDIKHILKSGRNEVMIEELITRLIKRREDQVLFNLVMKLNGPIQPVGESNKDEQRAKNLDSLIMLSGQIINEIKRAAEEVNRPALEYSSKVIADGAVQYLKLIKGEFIHY